MLDEAVGLIRRMHRGGTVTHDGPHYRVQEARIYPLPEHPVLRIRRAGNGFGGWYRRRPWGSGGSMSVSRNRHHSQRDR